MKVILFCLLFAIGSATAMFSGKQIAAEIVHLKRKLAESKPDADYYYRYHERRPGSYISYNERQKNRNSRAIRCNAGNARKSECPIGLLLLFLFAGYWLFFKPLERLRLVTVLAVAFQYFFSICMMCYKYACSFRIIIRFW